MYTFIIVSFFVASFVYTSYSVAGEVLQKRTFSDNYSGFLRVRLHYSVIMHTTYITTSA